MNIENSEMSAPLSSTSNSIISAPTTRSQSAAAAAINSQSTRQNVRKKFTNNGSGNQPAEDRNKWLSPHPRNSGNSTTDDVGSARHIKIGQTYQAEIPDYDPIGWRERDKKRLNDIDQGSTCLWKPPPANVNIPQDRLAKYLIATSDTCDWRIDQALAILLINNYDIDRATEQLPTFQNDRKWTKQEGLMFEQAFLLYGKSFGKIQQMMTNMKIPELINHYYVWKKKRLRQDGNFVGLDYPTYERCVTCEIPCPQLYETPEGSLCGACYLIWKRTGSYKAMKHSKPPERLELKVDAIVNAVSASNRMDTDSLAIQRQSELRQLEEKIASLRAASDGQKSNIRQLRPFDTDISHLHVQPPPCNVTREWSEHEKIMAFEAFRRYGKDFVAVAQVIGSKTSNSVKHYYESNSDMLDEQIRVGSEDRTIDSKAKKPSDAVTVD